MKKLLLSCFIMLGIVATVFSQETVYTNLVYESTEQLILVYDNVTDEFTAEGAQKIHSRYLVEISAFRVKVTDQRDGEVMYNTAIKPTGEPIQHYDQHDIMACQAENDPDNLVTILLTKEASKLDAAGILWITSRNRSNPIGMSITLSKALGSSRFTQ